jgi:FHS family L-fucose permease-like MFS transporter
MNSKVNISKILPVLMAFFVMSFCDLVGISVDKIKPIFGLTDFHAQLIPSAVFIWFLILSVGIGVLQNKTGKKNMVNIGMIITAIGLFIPFIFFKSFITFLIGFAFLGIGNTIVQVSANPLLINVVPANRTSSYLSFSQFVKAIGSMIAPWLATVFAAQFGDWKILFLVFGVVSILSVVWLGTVRIEETKQEGFKATYGTSFSLLGNGFILLMVLSIFLVVGIDVGFQSNSGQFLMKHFGIDEKAAVLGRSVYFFGRMLGTFVGAIMLTRISSRKFFMWTSVLGIVALVTILIMPVTMVSVAWGLVFIIGLAVANIFPLVFSIAVEKYPERSNEISGLMIMAVSGGAIIPPFIGWISDIRIILRLVCRY